MVSNDVIVFQCKQEKATSTSYNIDCTQSVLEGIFFLICIFKEKPAEDKNSKICMSRCTFHPKKYMHHLHIYPTVYWL